MNPLPKRRSRFKASSHITMGMGLLLSGMLLSVVSAALKWAPTPLPPASDLAGALYRAPGAHASAVTGFSLSLGFVSLGWLLTLCGLVSAALLLIPPSTTSMNERRLFLTVQVSLGLVPLSLAVYHWNLYAGVFCAATAGILLITAGVLLYGPQNRDANEGTGDPSPADAGPPSDDVV